MHNLRFLFVSLEGYIISHNSFRYEYIPTIVSDLSQSHRAFYIDTIHNPPLLLIVHTYHFFPKAIPSRQKIQSLRIPLPSLSLSPTEALSQKKARRKKASEVKGSRFSIASRGKQSLSPPYLYKRQPRIKRGEPFISVWRPLRFILGQQQASRERRGGLLVQRPDFCDLAWPWKTGRMLRDRGCKRRHASWERERSRGTSHERAYERFEVARISLGQPCLVTPLVSYLDR